MKLRRFFSFFIDIFITYSITRLLLFVLMFLEQKYSFELVFVICGMLYYVLANYAFKRTIGYFLLNIKITNSENKELKLDNFDFAKCQLFKCVPIVYGITVSYITLPL